MARATRGPAGPVTPRREALRLERVDQALDGVAHERGLVALATPSRNPGGYVAPGAGQPELESSHQDVPLAAWNLSARASARSSTRLRRGVQGLESPSSARSNWSRTSADASTRSGLRLG